MHIIKRVSVSLLLAIIGLVLFIGNRTLSQSQTRQDGGSDRIVHRSNAQREPVDLLSMRLAGNDINVGKKFDRKEDWLRTLELKLKNKSDKIIVSWSLTLEFPETATDGNEMAYTISGGTPRRAALNGERSVTVPTNGIFTVMLDDKEWEKLKSFLNPRHNPDLLHDVNIRISFLLFDDGTGWNGEYVVQDPNHPGRWTSPSRLAGDK